MERDYFMTADDAKEYGVIDNVVAHRQCPDSDVRCTIPRPLPIAVRVVGGEFCSWLAAMICA